MLFEPYLWVLLVKYLVKYLVWLTAVIHWTIAGKDIWLWLIMVKNILAGPMHICIGQCVTINPELFWLHLLGQLRSSIPMPFHQARYVSFVSSAIASKSGLALNQPLIGLPKERYELSPSQHWFQYQGQMILTSQPPVHQPWQSCSHLH